MSTKRTKAFRIRVSGPYACFTREAFRAERVSYETITPPAARGLLENIIWRKGFRWVVGSITVLNEIEWQNLARNEQGSFSDNLNLDNEVHGTPRKTLLLANVDYIIEAFIEAVGDCTGPEIKKMEGMADRYLRQGKCWHPPYLGMSDHPAKFRLIEDEAPEPEPLKESQDFGWMLHSYRWTSQGTRDLVGFFRAVMTNGVITVPYTPERIQGFEV